MQRYRCQGKGLSTDIASHNGTRRSPLSIEIGDCQVSLGLNCHRIDAYVRTPANGSGRKSTHRGAWANAEVSNDRGRASVGNGGACQNAEVGRRSKGNWLSVYVD